VGSSGPGTRPEGTWVIESAGPRIGSMRDPRRTSAPRRPNRLVRARQECRPRRATSGLHRHRDDARIRSLVWRPVGRPRVRQRQRQPTPHGPGPDPARSATSNGARRAARSAGSRNRDHRPRPTPIGGRDRQGRYSGGRTGTDRSSAAATQNPTTTDDYAGIPASEERHSSMGARVVIAEDEAIIRSTQGDPESEGYEWWETGRGRGRRPRGQPRSDLASLT